ncbi:mannitol dehydrogenase family protein, partial [Enterococcus faecium]|nr:mannitol dehydrogenase family protein [Enterococcus faecium]
SLLVSEIGYNEGLPVVESPGIIDPKIFLEEVITVRFSNPNIPNMPQRIATDTSQKVAIRYGETIKKYMEIEVKDPQTLVFIPLTL